MLEQQQQMKHAILVYLLLSSWLNLCTILFSSPDLAINVAQPSKRDIYTTVFVLNGVILKWTVPTLYLAVSLLLFGLWCLTPLSTVF
jgi:hypothetical protein